MFYGETGPICDIDRTVIGEVKRSTWEGLDVPGSLIIRGRRAWVLNPRTGPSKRETRLSRFSGCRRCRPRPPAAAREATGCVWVPQVTTSSSRSEDQANRVAPRNSAVTTTLRQPQRLAPPKRHRPREGDLTTIGGERDRGTAPSDARSTGAWSIAVDRSMSDGRDHATAAGTVSAATANREPIADHRVPTSPGGSLDLEEMWCPRPSSARSRRCPSGRRPTAHPARVEPAACCSRFHGQVGKVRNAYVSVDRPTTAR